MEEVVLTSDLGNKLVIKAQHTIEDHIVLQINDLGYHLPPEAAKGLMKLLKKVVRESKSTE